MISGIANSKNELDKLLANESIQLLITDIALFGSIKIDKIQSIKKQFPQLFILILINSISKPEFIELSKIGIKNIIYKNADRDELFAAIDSALKGKKYYSEEILDLIIESNESKMTMEEPDVLNTAVIDEI